MHTLLWFIHKNSLYESRQRNYTLPSIHKTKSTYTSKVSGGFVNYALVDPSRVELLSKLGIDPPLIHRFSLSDPQGGNRSLSRT